MLDSINTAILGNCTTNYLASAIQDECSKNGISANVYDSPDNQYNQEVLTAESGLYVSNPDLIIIHLEGKLLYPEWYDFKTLQLTNEEKLQEIQKVFQSITSIVQEINSHCNAKIILNNFKLPYYSPLGILDSKSSLGLKHMISKLNMQLEEWSSGNDNLYIFDYNGLCSQYGSTNAEEKKLYYITKSTMSLSFTKVLAREYMRYVFPMKSKNRKCLVLDLDNTLWGGIAGEDGLAGIKLDISGPGRSFYDFQNEILNLYNKGIILAINSKNNFEDAIDIIENHPYMVLRKKYFSSLKINWNSKVENLTEIAKELNLGIDSLVFFDDNPVERDYVKSMLPEVKVVDVPKDTSKYTESLQQLVEFEQLSITIEDTKRNEMYLANKKRVEAYQQYKDLNEYLASLQTTVTVAYANKSSIPRIAQLTQKTNQFNMTTIRYQQEDIEEMISLGKHIILSCSVCDKYGDNGLVGVCIVRLENLNAYIDSFLLSCRVLGRNVEYSFISAVVRILKELKVSCIYASFSKTDKNKANEDFYKKSGFNVVSHNEKETLYALSEDTKLKDFEYIDVVIQKEE